MLAKVAGRAYNLVMDRFWSKTKREGDCLIWQAAIYHDGYGAFKINGRQTRAHRVAWELSNGPIPPGLLVLHRCDVPRCVEPSHLFLGTNRDNVRDAISKGRQLGPPRMVGERNPQSKLTASAVDQIRQRYAEGKKFPQRHPKHVTIQELAAEFGVTFSLVSQVARGEAWRG